MRFDNQGRGILRRLIYPIQFSANPVEAVEHVFDYRILPDLTDTPPALSRRNM